MREGQPPPAPVLLAMGALENGCTSYERHTTYPKIMQHQVAMRDADAVGNIVLDKCVHDTDEDMYCVLDIFLVMLTRIFVSARFVVGTGRGHLNF